MRRWLEPIRCFLESQKVYDFGEMFVAEGVPEGYYESICASRRLSEKERI